MTAREFLRRFPHASKSAVAANCGYSDPQANRPGKPAELERDRGHAPLPASPLKKGPPARFLVCVKDVRRRLLDEDNLCEKFHVDLLRYSGVLPSDSPAQATIQTTQRKCEEGEEPHTEIEVYQIT